MPIRLESPMLSVDAGKMHKVDTRNVENLMSMWTSKGYIPLPSVRVLMNASLL